MDKVKVDFSEAEIVKIEDGFYITSVDGNWGVDIEITSFHKQLPQLNADSDQDFRGYIDFEYTVKVFDENGEFDNWCISDKTESLIYNMVEEELYKEF